MKFFGRERTGSVDLPAAGQPSPKGTARARPRSRSRTRSASRQDRDARSGEGNESRDGAGGDDDDDVSLSSQLIWAPLMSKSQSFDEARSDPKSRRKRSVKGLSQRLKAGSPLRRRKAGGASEASGALAASQVHVENPFGESDSQDGSEIFQGPPRRLQGPNSPAKKQIKQVDSSGSVDADLPSREIRSKDETTDVVIENVLSSGSVKPNPPPFGLRKDKDDSGLRKEKDESNFSRIGTAFRSAMGGAFTPASSKRRTRSRSPRLTKNIFSSRSFDPELPQSGIQEPEKESGKCSSIQDEYSTVQSMAGNVESREEDASKITETNYKLQLEDEHVQRESFGEDSSSSGSVQLMAPPKTKTVVPSFKESPDKNQPPHATQMPSLSKTIASQDTIDANIPLNSGSSRTSKSWNENDVNVSNSSPSRSSDGSKRGVSPSSANVEKHTIESSDLTPAGPRRAWPREIKVSESGTLLNSESAEKTASFSELEKIIQEYDKAEATTSEIVPPRGIQAVSNIAKPPRIPRSPASKTPQKFEEELVSTDEKNRSEGIEMTANGSVLSSQKSNDTYLEVEKMLQGLNEQESSSEIVPPRGVQATNFPPSTPKTMNCHTTPQEALPEIGSADSKAVHEEIQVTANGSVLSSLKSHDTYLEVEKMLQDVSDEDPTRHILPPRGVQAARLPPRSPSTRACSVNKSDTPGSETRSLGSSIEHEEIEISVTGDVITGDSRDATSSVTEEKCRPVRCASYDQAYTAPGTPLPKLGTCASLNASWKPYSINDNTETQNIPSKASMKLHEARDHLVNSDGSSIVASHGSTEKSEKESASSEERSESNESLELSTDELGTNTLDDHHLYPDPDSYDAFEAFLSNHEKNAVVEVLPPSMLSPPESMDKNAGPKMQRDTARNAPTTGLENRFRAWYHQNKPRNKNKNFTSRVVEVRSTSLVDFENTDVDQLEKVLASEPSISFTETGPPMKIEGKSVPLGNTDNASVSEKSVSVFDALVTQIVAGFENVVSPKGTTGTSEAHAHRKSEDTINSVKSDSYQAIEALVGMPSGLHDTVNGPPLTLEGRIQIKQSKAEPSEETINSIKSDSFQAIEALVGTPSGLQNAVDGPPLTLEGQIQAKQSTDNPGNSLEEAAERRGAHFHEGTNDVTEQDKEQDKFVDPESFQAFEAIVNAPSESSDHIRSIQIHAPIRTTKPDQVVENEPILSIMQAVNQMNPFSAKPKSFSNRVIEKRAESPVNFDDVNDVELMLQREPTRSFTENAPPAVHALEHGDPPKAQAPSPKAESLLSKMGKPWKSLKLFRRGKRKMDLARRSSEGDDDDNEDNNEDGSYNYDDEEMEQVEVRIEMTELESNDYDFQGEETVISFVHDKMSKTDSNSSGIGSDSKQTKGRKSRRCVRRKEKPNLESVKSVESVESDVFTGFDSWFGLNKKRENPSFESRTMVGSGSDLSSHDAGKQWSCVAPFCSDGDGPGGPSKLENSRSGRKSPDTYVSSNYWLDEKTAQNTEEQWPWWGLICSDGDDPTEPTKHELPRSSRKSYDTNSSSNDSRREMKENLLTTKEKLVANLQEPDDFQSKIERFIQRLMEVFHETRMVVIGVLLFGLLSVALYFFIRNKFSLFGRDYFVNWQKKLNVAFVGGAYLVINDIPRLTESLSNHHIKQNSVLHPSVGSVAKIIQTGNGMYYQWQTNEAFAGTHENQYGFNVADYDFGLCTVDQLLLGRDDSIGEAGNGDDGYYDDGRNPCIQDDYYLELVEEKLSQRYVQWDFLVIADQTKRMAIEDARNYTIESLVNDYAPLIKYTGATPVLLDTHAFLSDDVNMTDIPSFQALIYEGVIEYADSLAKVLPTEQAPLIAPVGLAYLMVYEESEAKWAKLFNSDGIHASIHGSYLIVCVLYATMYGHLPEKQFSTSNIEDLFAKSRKLFDDEIQYPTKRELNYYRSIARRVVLMGELPASFVGEEVDED